MRVVISPSFCINAPSNIQNTSLPTYDGECGLPGCPDADDVLGHALVPALVRGAHVAHSQAAVRSWGEPEIEQGEVLKWNDYLLDLLHRSSL